MRLTSFIALLRGINVSGRNKIPMDALRALGAELGWEAVQSYIQSGNLVFHAAAAPAALEVALEQAITSRFNLTIPVIVRAATDWPAYVRGNPLLAEAQQAPNRVMLTLSKRPPHPDAAAQLQALTGNGERIVQAGDALWVSYAEGAGTTKLTPALFDRLVGSPVTARNWRTVCQLEALACPNQTARD